MSKNHSVDISFHLIDDVKYVLFLFHGFQSFHEITLKIMNKKDEDLIIIRTEEKLKKYYHKVLNEESLTYSYSVTAKTQKPKTENYEPKEVDLKRTFTKLDLKDDEKLSIFLQTYLKISKIFEKYYPTENLVLIQDQKYVELIFENIPTKKYEISLNIKNQDPKYIGMGNRYYHKVGSEDTFSYTFLLKNRDYTITEKIEESDLKVIDLKNSTFIKKEFTEKDYSHLKFEEVMDGKEGKLLKVTSIYSQNYISGNYDIEYENGEKFTDQEFFQNFFLIKCVKILPLGKYTITFHLDNLPSFKLKGEYKSNNPQDEYILMNGKSLDFLTEVNQNTQKPNILSLQTNGIAKYSFTVRCTDYTDIWYEYNSNGYQYSFIEVKSDQIEIEINQNKRITMTKDEKGYWTFRLNQSLSYEDCENLLFTSIQPYSFKK